MTETSQHPDDFAIAFDRAFARLQVRVDTACSAQPDWPRRVAAGVRAALAFAAADPGGARALTCDAFAAGRAGHARYDRMLSHFAECLLAGRELCPDGERLPQIVEKALVGGLVAVVARRVEAARVRELPALAPEAIQFLLTPYLGSEWAREVAADGV